MPGFKRAVTNRGNEVYKSLENNVNPNWMLDPGLRMLNISIAMVFASAAANGYDGTLINGLLSNPHFKANLGQISSSYLGILVAAISLGATASFIPASYLGDYLGRRKTCGIGSIIMLLAALIQAFSSGPTAFLITRVLIGMGISFIQISAPALAAELAHPKQRGYITNMFQTMYYWGAILCACIILGTLYIASAWSWRVPSLVQVLFPMIQLIGLKLVPESPRWLISRGRHTEALYVLAKYHANGETTDELVQFEYQEICEMLGKEKREGETGWMAFLRSPGDRHRLFLCIVVGVMVNWCGNGIVSYYLSSILYSVGINNPFSQTSINVGLQCWNAILSAGGALAAEKYGRRPLWLLSSAGMLGAFIIITALSAEVAVHQNDVAGIAVVPMLYIFFGFYDIAFTPLSVAYIVEILPYHIRAKGLSVKLTAAFGANFFNQYVNPIALASWHWKWYFMYIGTLSMIIPTIYFLFPETKGRTLEEIAAVFDGASAEPDVLVRTSNALVEDERIDPAAVASLIEQEESSTAEGVHESPDKPSRSK